MIKKYQTWKHTKTGKFYMLIDVCQIGTSGDEVIFMQPEDDCHAEVKVCTKHLFLNGEFELKLKQREPQSLHIIPANDFARLLQMSKAKRIYIATHRSDGSHINSYAPDGGPLREIPFQGKIG